MTGLSAKIGFTAMTLYDLTGPLGHDLGMTPPGLRQLTRLGRGFMDQVLGSE